MAGVQRRSIQSVARSDDGRGLGSGYRRGARFGPGFGQEIRREPLCVPRRHRLTRHQRAGKGSSRILDHAQHVVVLRSISQPVESRPDEATRPTDLVTAQASRPVLEEALYTGDLERGQPYASRLLTRRRSGRAEERDAREDGQGRGADRPSRNRSDQASAVAWIANAAPSGSRHCATKSPPGTSIGPFKTWPPSSFTFSAAALTSATAM